MFYSKDLSINHAAFSKETENMSKTGKIITGLVLASIAAIAIVVTLLFQNLDGIIKKVIEDTGTKITGTTVSLDNVKLTLADGRGELDGLRVANPTGFGAGPIFAMNQAALEIDPASVTGKVIVIREVIIEGASLNAEQKGLATNLKALLDNIEKNTPKSAEPATVENTSPTDVRLMLERFAFTNTRASLVTEQWGEQQLKLKDIVLTNIGDKDTGLSPEALAGRMVQALVKQTEKAVQDHLTKLAKDAAKAEVNKQLDKHLDADDKAKLEGFKSMFKKKDD